MKVVGIIAEYNPFHLGHQYQIQYIRNTLKADYIIAVMSGDYVQRGIPALLPKHERARMALACGVDLVLELPVQASTASAEGFAFTGVSLLDGLGIVDELCFGSECGEIAALEGIAGILNEEPAEYRQALQNHLKQGISFPAARDAALNYYLRKHGAQPFYAAAASPDVHFISAAPDITAIPLTLNEDSNDYASLLSSPNNILGIEYCRAILKLHSNIKPVTLKREGAGYHEKSLTAGELPSASAVRALILAGSRCRGSAHDSNLWNIPAAQRTDADLTTGLFKSEQTTVGHVLAGLPDRELQRNLNRMIPAAAVPVLTDALSRNAIITNSDFDEILHYCLLNENRESLTDYADMSPELADRIMKKLNGYEGFDSFTDLLKTKELTRTRIQRALLHTLLHIKAAPGTANTINNPDVISIADSPGRKAVFSAGCTVPYARILGFRRECAPLLTELKKRSSLPLLTKLADAEKILAPDALNDLETNTRASNICESLLCKKEGRNFIHEYQKQLVIL